MRSKLKQVRVMFQATADEPSPAAVRQAVEHELTPEIEIPLAEDGGAGQPPFGHGQTPRRQALKRKTAP